MIGKEEESRLRDLGWISHTLQRVKAPHDLMKARIFSGDRCHRSTWEESVDANILGPMFCGQNLGHADQPCLCCGKGAHAGQPDRVPDEGGRENDRAAAASAHCGYLMLCRVKSAAEIHRNHLMPVAFGHVGDRTYISCNARIVEGTVKSAEAVLSSLNQLCREAAVLDVSGDKVRLATPGQDLVRDFL